MKTNKDARSERVEAPDPILDSQDSEDSEGLRRSLRRGVASRRRDESTQRPITESEASRSGSVDHPLERVIAEAIAAEETSISGEKGQEWRRLFAFTRRVKTRFRFGVPLDKAWSATDEVIQKMCGGWGAAFASMQQFDEWDDERFELEFKSVWQKAYFLEGEGPLEQALRKARAFQFNWTPKGAKPAPRYNEFVTTCIMLQHTVGDADICLPQQKVAKAMNTDQHEVSEWCRRAVKEGFLVVREAYSWRPGGRNRATQYRVPETLVEAIRKHMETA